MRRSALTVLATMLAAPLSAQMSASEVVPAMSPALATYPMIRLGQVRSAAFLTEMRVMPYGKVLGPVSPAAVPARLSPEMSFVGATIGVLPPSGAAYQKGDTIFLATVIQGPKGWGEVVQPTGLAVVEAVNPRQTEAKIITTYGPVREGQVTLPIGPIPMLGTAAPQAVNGPTGNYLAAREVAEVQQINNELFVDMGRAVGLKIGDFIEFRRHAGPHPGQADAIDQLLAVGRVVSLGEKSSTVRLIKIVDPAIPVWSPVLRVATLGN